MKINLPINNFKLEGNKVFINDLIVEYEEISEDTREIVESLISKGAYGSALLTLNMFYNVKKFNEADYSHKDYVSYLSECNNLMEECVVETKEAHNFRPLINLNGLEIMENATSIARGKGDTLLIEDFRTGRTVLNERYLKSAKYGSPEWHTYKIGGNEYEFKCQTWETRGGWGHSVTLYDTRNFDIIAEVDVRYYNRTWESFTFQTAMLKACREAMNKYDNLEADMDQLYDRIQEGDRGTRAEMQRTTISESANVFNRDEAKKVLGGGNIVVISKKGYVPTNFIVADGAVFYNNREISFGWNMHPNMRTVEDLLDFMEKMSNEGYTISYNMTEEAEGTQCSDIAEKKDQSVGSLQKPKKPKKFIVKEEKEPFTPSEIDKYVANYNSKTGSHKHPEDFTWMYMAGTVDGMKIKGVKGTQIFDVNSGEYLGSYNDYAKEAFKVPRNHGFKGFTMNESGFYTRGNYVLIKEGSKIKAVSKKSLKIK